MNIQFQEEPNRISAGSKFVCNNKRKSHKWKAMRLAQYVAGMRGVKYVYKSLIINTWVKFSKNFLWRKYFIKNIFKNYEWGFGTLLS